MMDATKKLFRVADLSLVVYRGDQIIGVKHSEVGPWMVWDLEHARWNKAAPADGRAFEQLPLQGHVDS